MFSRTHHFYLITLFTLFGFYLISNKSVADDLDGAVEEYQRSLIKQETTGSNFVMIFKEGKRIYHKAVESKKTGDKKINDKTVFPIWSMSKPITTVAMMMLHEEGKFDWNDEVSKYIPCFKELKFKDGDQIRPCTQPLRIIHLMTHRTGWGYPRLENGIDIDGVPDVSFDSIYPNQTRFNDLQSFVESCANTPLAFEPGTRYLYGINQGIQGRLIEIISGLPLEEFLKSRLFEPLGMVDTGFSMTPEQRGRFQPLFINTGSLKGFTYLLDQMTYQEESKAHFGDAGLVSTIEDYSRFCEMLAMGGKFRGKTIISPASIQTMTKKWSGGFPEEPDAFEPLKGHYNGFSLFVLDKPSEHETASPKGIYGWAGYHNTHFWIDPQNKMFGLFMARARPFSWEIPIGLRKVVYQTFPEP